MVKEIEVSVIIPVYNGEQYIKRCLDSIISQSSFKALELIIVNDGSTDKTKSIIEEYLFKYSNIKVFNIPNSGVSYARNYGIKNAIGTYIAFVDADDWIEDICFSSMLEVARGLADIVAAGMIYEFDNGESLVNNITKVDEWVTNEETMKRFLTGKLDVHSCNKLFRRELLQKITFDTEFKVAEDRLFTCKCISASNKILFMNKAFYHYCQNDTSVMHESFSSKRFDELVVGERIIQIIKDKYPELLTYANSMVINSKSRILGEMYLSGKNDEYHEMYKRLKKDIKEFSLIKNIGCTSTKHWISLLLVKIHPWIYAKLRENQKLKFYKKQ